MKWSKEETKLFYRIEERGNYVNTNFSVCVLNILYVSLVNCPLLFDKRMHNYLKDVPIVPKNIVLLKYISFLSVFEKKEGQLRRHLAYL